VLHRVAQTTRYPLERLLQALVGERLDAAAVVTDEVVMVLVVPAEWLEPRDAVADVDSLDEA
jgi:hypothetical protein